jgi:hypothetical protein
VAFYLVFGMTAHPVPAPLRPAYRLARTVVRRLGARCFDAPRRVGSYLLPPVGSCDRGVRLSPGSAIGHEQEHSRSRLATRRRAVGRRPYSGETRALLPQNGPAITELDRFALELIGVPRLPDRDSAPERGQKAGFCGKHSATVEKHTSWSRLKCTDRALCRPAGPCRRELVHNNSVTVFRICTSSSTRRTS